MADTTLKEGTRLDGLLNDHILYTDGGSEICGLAEHDAALIHEELRALRESHDALVDAARFVLEEHQSNVLEFADGTRSTSPLPYCMECGGDSADHATDCVFASLAAALAKAEALHG